MLRLSLAHLALPLTNCLLSAVNGCSSGFHETQSGRYIGDGIIAQPASQ